MPSMIFIIMLPDINKPLLTIGVPTYNGAFNFEELFASIKNLGLAENEYEVVIVDNASTDNTIEILDGLTLKHKNLRYYQNSTNIGRIQNWNEVIKYTTGKYLILMNVNDRFMEFDASKFLNYLDDHPNIPMVLTDLIYVYPESSNVYPEWQESGVIEIQDYIKKTFLDTEYMEYHSVGTLHQHIFRTDVIKDNHLKFDPTISRTTDRVFAGQVAKFGGGSFFYTNQIMVKWQLNDSRFHSNVHHTYKNFDMDIVWMNEYKANLQLAQIADIPLSAFLECQAIWAKYYTYKYKMVEYASKLSIKLPAGGLEEVTAEIYYNYIKALANFNQVSLNYSSIKLKALNKALKLPLRKYKLLARHPRSLKPYIN